MAAIDKIYINTFEKYSQFREWCEKQPMLKDKYGVSVPLTKYLYKYSKEDNWNGGKPVFQGPYYADAYLIKNCPFDFIQKELMLNYGHWSQEKINEAYNIVINRTEKNKDFYTWLSEDDFKVIDGVITMPNLEKSDYEKIKDNELFNTPFTSQEVTYGTHFKCVKHPRHFYNKPYECKDWFIDVILPTNGFMWYHSNYNSWDFSDEFVVSKWASSTAFCSTIKSLKRLMIKKWRLPIGTKVRATGRYIEDTYEFLITK